MKSNAVIEQSNGMIEHINGVIEQSNGVIEPVETARSYSSKGGYLS